MTKMLLISALIMSSLGLVNAQTDTIFFNSSWEPTSRSEAAYYRPHPATIANGFLIKDYYMSGKMQFEGVSTDTTTEHLNGVVTWYSEEGKVLQKRHFKDGSMEGMSTTYDESGKITANLEYKDGAPFAGSEFSSDQGVNEITRYEGGKKLTTELTSIDSRSKAHCVVTYIDSTRLKILFYNQKGEFVGEFQKTGEELENTNGIFVNYQYNPLIVDKITTIEKGKFLSPIHYYYSNGKLKKQEFVNDESVSTKEIFYTTEGKQLDSLIYKDGAPYSGTKIEFFYPNSNAFEADKIERSTRYSEGEMNGAMLAYYPNGKIHSQKEYKKGIIEGDQIVYDSLGVITYKANYKEGSPWDGTVYEEYDNSYTTYKSGEIVLTKRLHPNGKLAQLKNKMIEESYDTTGVCIAHLDYKDGNPFNGKSVSAYLGAISSMEEYKDGILTLSMSYNDGTTTDKTEYSASGDIVGKTDYFTNGKIKSHTLYENGSEKEIDYFTFEGKPAGKLFVNDNGEYNGEKYSFENDKVISFEMYENNKVVKMKTFNNDGILLADVDYNGASTFYDISTPKTYKCSYKNGEPFEGTVVEFDSYNNGITDLKNYKNGALEGESIVYEYNYDLAKNIPVTISNYRNGLQEGIQKEFKNDTLISSKMFQNGLQNGETKFYNAQGQLLSTATYKKGDPFNGVVYEFDYQQQPTSIIPYINGAINGEAKYYNDNVLDYVLNYTAGVITKRVSYLDGVAKYTMNYKENEKYDGQEFESDILTEYKNGKELGSTEYSNSQLAQIIKKRIVNGDSILETVYYQNGNPKSTISYVGYQKVGRSNFYNQEGKEIARGTYNEGMPVEGNFAYFTSEDDSTYLLLELQPKQLIVTEMKADVPIRKLRYDLLQSDSTELESGEITNILNGLGVVFENYDIDKSY